MIGVTLNVAALRNDTKIQKCISILFFNFLIAGGVKPLPKKATRNVTMAALLIEEVTRTLANE